MQESHEYYISEMDLPDGKPSELLSPEDRIRFFINRVLLDISHARCGVDLVIILENE